MTETTMYQVEDGWVELADGTAFYFGAPTDDMIDVREIAHSLSRICRYNGHTRRHYSVAEHAIHLADHVAGTSGTTATDALTALHHDDAEYIIGDMARPVKVKMPEFKALEKILDQAIARKFGTYWPFPPWLKELDARIIKDERLSVMNPSDNDWGTDSLDALGVRFWNVRGRFPFIVKWEFLRRHYHWMSLPPGRLLARRA